ITLGTVPYVLPMSIAILASVLAVVVSPRARDAWRRRSRLGFYVAATVVMYFCSFGPEPSVRGRLVLYQAPYAWLMHLPLFSGEIRVPARFAMLAVLTLGAAAALAFEKLRLRGSTRTIVAAGLM